MEENNRARSVRPLWQSFNPVSLPSLPRAKDNKAETKAQSNARNREAAGLVAADVISQSKGLVFKLVNARNKEASGSALSVTFQR